MTNFIYNMQDELFHLPLEDFSTIKKLVDHIEAQGKQLRELNAGITKRNTTIEKYEREKKDLQERNSYLYKKVVELNNGIRNSEDLTWKQKYEALLHSSEQAIGTLQKKCQEYKNSESEAITSTIETLVKENKELKEEVNLYIGLCNTKNKEVEALAKAVHCPWGDNAEIISAKTARIKELEEKNKKLEERRDELKNMCADIMVEKISIIKELEEEKKAIEKRCREAEKALEDEKQVSKDLNVIINNKNKLLDEYMTKYNNLEHNYNEEVRMKEQFKTTCVKEEITIKRLREEVFDYIRLTDALKGKLASIGELANKIDDVILSEE